jgi:hypothetical protein
MVSPKRWRRDIFVSKNKRDQIGPARRDKGTMIMLLVDAPGIPLPIDIEPANVN